MLVLYHTAFKFGGIVSVSFWSMVLVVLSGVVGRFIYVQIPRTIQGQELGINAMNDLKENLASKVTKAIDFDGKTLDDFKVITSTERYREFSIIKALLFIPNDYFKIRSILRKIKKDLKLAGLPKIVRKEIINSAKIALTARIVPQSFNYQTSGLIGVSLLTVFLLWPASYADNSWYQLMIKYGLLLLASVALLPNLLSYLLKLMSSLPNSFRIKFVIKDARQQIGRRYLPIAAFYLALSASISAALMVNSFEKSFTVYLD